MRSVEFFLRGGFAVQLSVLPTHIGVCVWVLWVGPNLAVLSMVV